MDNSDRFSSHLGHQIDDLLGANIRLVDRNRTLKAEKRKMKRRIAGLRGQLAAERAEVETLSEALKIALDGVVIRYSDGGDETNYPACPGEYVVVRKRDMALMGLEFRIQGVLDDESEPVDLYRLIEPVSTE